MESQNDLYGKAAAELDSIERQIAALEKRRIELRQFVELGRKLFRNPFDRPLGFHPSAPAAQQAQELAARESSLKAKVLALSRDFLSVNAYATTTVLVSYIEGKGVPVSGKDKNTTVSVILSRSPDFVSDRTRGWSLVKKNPQDVAASAGSSTA